MDIKKFFPQYENQPDILKELQEYQKDLEVLADADVSIQFTNKGKDHAILVMSQLFECAYKNIRIFARDFNGAISDNELYLQNLKKFLEADQANKVEVIFETEPYRNSKAVALLKKERAKNPEKVTLRKAQLAQINEFKKYLVNSEKMIHFTLADDPVKGFNKYRCETDTRQYLAILNFDDTKFCNQLIQLYDILSKDAVDIAN